MFRPVGVIAYPGPRGATTSRRPIRRCVAARPLPTTMAPTPAPTVDPRDAGRPAAPGATRTRFAVLGVLCLLSGILYLDRICIAAALDSIQADLRLTNTECRYVL